MPAGIALACLISPLTAQQASPAKIEPIRSSITVDEKVTLETPASVTVLDKATIEQTPGFNLDDRLRTVPGFTLFRRSSSIVANPTTQGVSLRGLGSSGASRTLVLWDGIPINDAFGGWVYWTRFSPEELDRVEVSRGASTSVFGDRAMSGAIALFSRPAAPLRLTGSYEGGNNNSHALTGGISNLWRKWAFSTQLRAAETDGYFIVPESRRGPVDTRAGVKFVATDTRLDWLGSREKIFLKFDMLAEERKNGTTLTANSTGLGSIAAHYFRDDFTLLAYHVREDFHASFSAVTADRKRETLSYNQTVPSDSTAVAGMWARHTTHWNALIGADFNRVEGYSTDSLFPTGKRIGGGILNQGGGFAQTDLRVGALQLFAGARQHSSGFFSPSAGYSLGRKRLRARGSVYRSFRTPTLNELYREFRVGNTITQANAALLPEKVFGAETGVDFVGEKTRAGVTFYRNSLTDLITNVTLSSSPSQILRQRRNAASALARGAEFNLRRTWRDFRGEFGYLFADSRVPTGERIAQTPRHQGSAQIIWTHGATLISGGVRSVSSQFDDDKNAFLLPGYPTLQLVMRHRLTPSLSATASFENLLNREYLTALTPTPNIGAPRLWRAGLRWDGSLKKTK
jgi:outer membrane cobalamin receptor